MRVYYEPTKHGAQLAYPELLRALRRAGIKGATVESEYLDRTIICVPLGTDINLINSIVDKQRANYRKRWGGKE